MTLTLEGPTFTHSIDLVNGTNSISVSVVDAFGNRNSTSAHVVTLAPPDTEEEVPPTGLLLPLVLVALALTTAFIVLRRRKTRSD